VVRVVRMELNADVADW